LKTTSAFMTCSERVQFIPIPFIAQHLSNDDCPDKMRGYQNCCVRYHSTVSCEKTELIKKPFGMWTWVGPRKHIRWRGAQGNVPDGKERKGKEEYLHGAFLAKVVHSKRSGMDHTVLPGNNTMPAFPS